MADPNLESVVVPSRDAAKAINKGAHKTGSSSSPHNQDPGSNPNPDIESATAVPSPPKGDLINRAGQALGQVVHSPTGQAVGGLLKGAAKRALPLAGAALGGCVIGGPLGATIGISLATAAGSALGLEAEALSAEDREFEGAEKFVKMAGQAVESAVTAPLTANPAATGQTTMRVVAKKIVPGLLKAELRSFLDLAC
jgi:hypothetical protein